MKKNDKQGGNRMRPCDEALKKIYGEGEECGIRFEYLSRKFTETFGNVRMEFFSAPGRTEIVGNHTDHNGGKVLAASISMDTIGAAYPNHSELIEIVSEGYGEKVVVDLEKLDTISPGTGVLPLTAGIAKATKDLGYNISGFSAYISSNMISSAGLSSSASFEMLLCAMIDHFFNNSSMDPVLYAKIGQYAENKYWNKQSGLMDQMACAVGGTVLMDFQKDVSYERIDFDFERMGEQLIIVNTGKGHADLSKEYSEVPQEMKEVASFFGEERLCGISLEKICQNLHELIKVLDCDRAILRAIHFFKENERVEEITAAIREKDDTAVKKIIFESGKSSWELLQNCYVASSFREQKISLCLAMTELFLKEIGDGCCRVHGGGFAGVIMCAVPVKYTEAYIRFMSGLAGRENIHLLKIRQEGAVHLEK